MDANGLYGMIILREFDDVIIPYLFTKQLTIWLRKLLVTFKKRM
jgi:hypothetical protein